MHAVKSRAPIARTKSHLRRVTLEESHTYTLYTLYTLGETSGLPSPPYTTGAKDFLFIYWLHATNWLHIYIVLKPFITYIKLKRYSTFIGCKRYYKHYKHYNSFIGCKMQPTSFALSPCGVGSALHLDFIMFIIPDLVYNVLQ